jgi:mono/diheme cytochrome c family protein
MKMNLNKRITALAIAILAISCTSNSTSDLTNPSVVGNVTYTKDIKPIVDQNCIRCHGDVQLNGAPMALTTYAFVKDAILTRPLLVKISKENGEPGLMPNGGPRLPQEKIDLFFKWKEQGLQQ